LVLIAENLLKIGVPIVPGVKKLYHPPNGAFALNPNGPLVELNPKKSPIILYKINLFQFNSDKTSCF